MRCQALCTLCGQLQNKFAAKVRGPLIQLCEVDTVKRIQGMKGLLLLLLVLLLLRLLHVNSEGPGGQNA
jgi:hypothetical protein